MLEKTMKALWRTTKVITILVRIFHVHDCICHNNDIYIFKIIPTSTHK